VLLMRLVTVAHKTKCNFWLWGDVILLIALLLRIVQVIIVNAIFFSGGALDYMLQLPSYWFCYWIVFICLK
jgi:hypothetical protein